MLVPLPTSTDDHQRRNAEVLAASGAAVVIEERELTGERLAEQLLALVARRRAAAHGCGAPRGRWRGPMPRSGSPIAWRQLVRTRAR